MQELKLMQVRNRHLFQSKTVNKENNEHRHDYKHSTTKKYESGRNWETLQEVKPDLSLETNIRITNWQLPPEQP